MSKPEPLSAQGRRVIILLGTFLWAGALPPILCAAFGDSWGAGLYLGCFLPALLITAVAVGERSA